MVESTAGQATPCDRTALWVKRQRNADLGRVGHRHASDARTRAANSARGAAAIEALAVGAGRGSGCTAVTWCAVLTCSNNLARHRLPVLPTRCSVWGP